VRYGKQGSSRPDPFRFSDADVELQETLDNLDDANNYAQWIFTLILPYLGEKVLEVGAGHGTFTEMLARGGRTVVASEISGRSAQFLKERFSNSKNVEVVQQDIDATESRGPFDTAILINVLEHIEDDDDALRRLFATLRVGGWLVLWVPAFPALYSEFDRKVGHFRRYTLGGLSAQLQQAGFKVVDIRYANAVGAIAWWVVAHVLRLTPTRRASVQAFDRYVVPAIKRIESKVPPPFGQSIFVAASADPRG
jgi:SAM-dependent methyltransferase